MKPFLGVVLTLIVAAGILYGYRHQQEARHLADGEIHCTGCMTPEERTNFDKRNAAEAQELAGATTPKADNPLPPSAPAVAAAEAIQTPPPGASVLDPGQPTGTVPGGEGIYQWFRQEKMTWRLDTKTGASCVAFATSDEWQKPPIASHACGLKR